MALYIDLGSNVDPDWMGVLATSPDGVNWETFDLTGAQVTYRTFKSGSTVTGVGLSVENEYSNILHLHLEDVVNQVSWTNDEAGRIAALSDIADWIGDANTVGGAAMMAAGLATQTTLLDVLAKLEEVRIATNEVDLQTDTLNMNLDGVETLIGSTNTNLDTIEATLTNIEAEDFGTEGTLLTIKAVLDSILTSLTVLEIEGALVTESTTANISATTSSIILQVANDDRKELVIHNNSTSFTDTLFIKKEGTIPTGASVTDYTFAIPYQGTAIIDDYKGEVSGVWDNASGFAMVTESFTV